MARRKTHLTLEDLSLGYLRYLKENNVIETNYEIIDILIDAFMLNYADENDININEIREESLELQKQSLRPQSSRTKAENKKAALKAMTKIRSTNKKERTNILDDVADNNDWLKNFEGDVDEE